MKYFVTADHHVRSNMGRIARNAESRTIKRLRIQSWFQAVSHASGLSAGELEYQFSLANEQCPRSCIWDKYRRGDVAPRDSLIKAVEIRYPGTEQWLHSPLWRFADEVPIGMAEIRSAFECLPNLLHSMFVVRQATQSTIFWRRPVETSEACEILLRFNSIDALIATLILVKEAETAQIQDQHMEGIHFALSYLAKFTRHPAIGGAVNSDLQIYLKSRWENLVYPDIPEDDYDAQTGSNSYLYPDTGSISEPSSMRQFRWQNNDNDRLQLIDQTITLSQLESHLWESANILRGPVDAADFKTYIFPLLFFKRICDVWDDEYQEIVDETGDEQLAWFPESHRFQIPEDCHWNDVRSVPTNVGGALQHAMREIEKANPETLYGVFGDAQWTNKDRLSDALLKDLIEHFSRISFGNKNITSDVLGDAYEYLIKKFADATNKKAGEFYTPRSVVRLMIDMLDPKEAETIYDPACGTGGMLLAAVQHVKEQHGDVKRLWGKLYGQEKNLTTSSIARMNLFLHGIEDFQVVRGDTLRNPAFFEGDRLATFDCVIANPPFSLEKWGEDLWLNDPFGRNFAGLPPTSSGDFAWVQHMVKSMADGAGRMAVVLPQGALFRKGAEGDIRQKLLQMDLVEAVIGLAPNLFYGTGLAACILVLRKRKSAEHKQKVLIADASRLFRRGRAQNFLEPEHATEILGWYHSFADVQDAVRVVTLDEIKAEDWTLNISRYVLPPLQEDIPPLPEAIAAFKEALSRCREAEERLAQVMTEGGWLQ